MPAHNFVSIAGTPVSATRSFVRTKPALAVGLLLSGGLLVGAIDTTGADFRDQMQVTADVASGTVGLSANGERTTASVKFTLPDGSDQLRPGGTMTQVIQVQNFGTIPVNVSSTLKGQGPEFLGSQLDAKVSAKPTAGPAVSYTAKAQNMAVPTFSLEPGETVPVEVVLTLPPSTTTAWQGKTDTLTLTLTAVQK